MVTNPAEVNAGAIFIAGQVRELAAQARDAAADLPQPTSRAVTSLLDQIEDVYRAAEAPEPDHYRMAKYHLRALHAQYRRAQTRRLTFLGGVTSPGSTIQAGGGGGAGV